LLKKSKTSPPAIHQGKMAYITNLYPLLSETFIIAEVQRLQEAGYQVCVYSLFKPKSAENELDDPALKAQTVYWSPYMRLLKLLPSHLYFLMHTPAVYLRTFRYAFQLRNRQASLFSLLRWAVSGVEHRDQVAYADRQNILLHFFIMMPFAAMVRQQAYTWMHAAFANIPASFAMLASRMTGVPYSLSAHAMDIFITPERLPEKFDNARFVVTCNHFNKTYLQQNYPDLDLSKVYPIYHGIDLQRFHGTEQTQPAKPAVLLSVGRLVRKKGLGVLLRACLILKGKEIPFQLWIVGDGPERPRLEMFCRMNHLHEKVKFWGACLPQQIVEFYQQATLFVLPCVQDENGDQDGIPNVIAEAMAMRLPVVSTMLSAIPELVSDQITGRLLPPNNPDQLAQVLEELLKNQKLAAEMGEKGRQRVEQVFDAAQTSDELIALFASHLSEPQSQGT